MYEKVVFELGGFFFIEKGILIKRDEEGEGRRKGDRKVFCVDGGCGIGQVVKCKKLLELLRVQIVGLGDLYEGLKEERKSKIDG